MSKKQRRRKGLAPFDWVSWLSDRDAQVLLACLMAAIEEDNDISKLSRTRHHCHLKRGRPTYVAVWDVHESKQRLIEVTYVGTHARAPY